MYFVFVYSQVTQLLFCVFQKYGLPFVAQLFSVTFDFLGVMMRARLGSCPFILVRIAGELWVTHVSEWFLSMGDCKYMLLVHLGLAHGWLPYCDRASK